MSDFLQKEWESKTALFTIKTKITSIHYIYIYIHKSFLYKLRVSRDSHISASKRKHNFSVHVCMMSGVRSQPRLPPHICSTFLSSVLISPSTWWDVPRGSGEGVGVQRSDLHRFKFVGEDVEDVVKFLIALCSVGLCAGLTPEQPQGKLCPESLQQLGDRLPASCWSRCLISVYLTLQQALTAKNLYDQICRRKKKKQNTTGHSCRCVCVPVSRVCACCW